MKGFLSVVVCALLSLASCFQEEPGSTISLREKTGNTELIDEPVRVTVGPVKTNTSPICGVLCIPGDIQVFTMTPFVSFHNDESQTFPFGSALGRVHVHVEMFGNYGDTGVTPPNGASISINGATPCQADVRNGEGHTSCDGDVAGVLLGLGGGNVVLGLHESTGTSGWTVDRGTVTLTYFLL